MRGPHVLVRGPEDAFAMIPVFVFRAIKLPLVCLLAVETAAVTMLPVYWSRMRETEAVLTESEDRLEAELNQEIHRATQQTLKLLAPDDAPAEAIDSETLAERQASEADTGTLTEDEVAQRLKASSEPVPYIEYPPGTDALLDALESYRGSFALKSPWDPPIASVAVKMAQWQAKSADGSVRTNTTSVNPSAAAAMSGTQAVSRATPESFAPAPTGIQIENPAENGLTVHFLYGRNVEKLDPGQTRRWTETAVSVKFDTGLPNAEPSKEQLLPGAYRFELTKESGWQLRRLP